MIVRSLSALVAVTMLVACSQGQKGRSTAITTEMDSVSYAIGADIGGNLRKGKIDSLNADLIAAGLADGLDSTLLIDQASLEVVMRSF
ncbi:MAG TPA: FKBP-type peptidyl-prolyl cis-trans isomerase N-terminal domain-containing protein, partial [Flavobacteriales bacterium]|nr:FKBP-type peptidyl-prolyl cis-trans isomerase N-terminal domain-containing protein [Flavobacteriales bacterium]